MSGVLDEDGSYDEYPDEFSHDVLSEDSSYDEYSDDLSSEQYLRATEQIEEDEELIKDEDQDEDEDGEGGNAEDENREDIDSDIVEYYRKHYTLGKLKTLVDKNK